MNLDDFEEMVNEVIVERGWHYYMEDRVKLSKRDDVWEGVVFGSQQYLVKVQLGQEETILTSQCNCPYDGGPVCKHEVAVYFELRDIEEEEIVELDQSISGMLRDYSKEELIQLIEKMVQWQPSLRQELTLHMQPVKSLENARELILSSIRDAADRDGFVSFGAGEEAVKGAEKVFEMARQLPTNQLIEKVELYVLILKEMLDLISYCDDSDGEVDEMVEEVLEELDNLHETSGPVDDDQRSQVISLIIEHAQSSLYIGWSDWRLDLIRVVVSLAKTPDQHTQVTTLLEELERQLLAKRDWNSNYQLTGIQELRYQLIAEQDEKLGQAYLESHLDNNDFRETLIQQKMKAKAYESVINLCLEGEQKAIENRFSGTLKKWRSYRYKVYLKQGDQVEQKKLGETLLLSGDFEYYDRLRKLYTEKEWLPIRQNLVAQSQKAAGSIYLQIIIQERMQSEILAHCQVRPERIVEFGKHLLPEYFEEVSTLFKQTIYGHLSFANSRRDYQRGCEFLSSYRLQCGKKPASLVAQDLCAKYPKRRAMIDEINIAMARW